MKKRAKGPGSRRRRREIVQSRVGGQTRKAVRKAVQLGLAPTVTKGTQIGTPIVVDRIGKFMIHCTNQGKGVTKDRRYLWQISCNGHMLDHVSGEFRYGPETQNGLYVFLDYVWALLVQDIRVPDLYAALDKWLAANTSGPPSDMR